MSHPHNAVSDAHDLYCQYGQSRDELSWCSVVKDQTVNENNRKYYTICMCCQENTQETN